MEQFSGPEYVAVGGQRKNRDMMGMVTSRKVGLRHVLKMQTCWAIWPCPVPKLSHTPLNSVSLKTVRSAQQEVNRSANNARLTAQPAKAAHKVPVDLHLLPIP